ncbi:MAG: primosomal protein N', partial [Clostridia bacterium]|nr:primosomal protein N' [Clostridia bacterium]
KPERTVPEIALAPKQEEIYRSLREKAFSGESSFALLYGITGSGKTHVYIKLIADVIRAGKRALLLVPEIALTPQMIERFYAVFGERVATLHSALSDGERKREWLRIRRGEADVVVGTRSAVFAPIPEESLGVIIIDEEHEYSYKSEASPRYHARDVAKYRAAKAGILLLLGSATPSLESEYLARKGEYALYELEERYNNAALAEVTVVDRKEDLRRGSDRAVGSFLADEIRKTRERGEQTILFLNRRGRNRRLICTDCGASVECPNCSSPMSYHATNRKLHCHICGYSCPPPLVCPACGESHLMLDKAGTQKIEEEIEELIPGATYLRMDADTTGTRFAHSEILKRFRDEKIDILIGTQMITKGLDFPNVTLVGVLDADMSLFSGDFRAGERTFSLLTQVVGRSGRGEKKGRAVIQTYSPRNAVLLAAERQDYKSFYESEIALRQALRLPPVSSILAFLVSGEDEKKTADAALRFSRRLKGALAKENVKVLGPAEAAVYKANSRYRWTMTVRAEDLRPLRRTAEGLLYEFLKQKENKGVSLSVDENPYDMP